MNAFRKIIPQRVSAMSDEARDELYKQAQSLQEERTLLGRSALKAAWIIGGSGWAVATIAVVSAASVFPLKTHEAQYFPVDQTTGWVGQAVPAADAPKLFNDATIENALRTYVEWRENYVYENDDLAFRRVALMSTPDEQIRYKAMHDDPKSPLHALGKGGYVRVDNFRMSKVGDGKFGSMIYLVRFEYRMMRAGQIVPPKGEPYAATITFAFHPEYPMTQDDRTQNPTGLQVSSYQVTKEIVKGRD